MEAYVLFYIILFAVAFLYAAVGHGGASGYLALMVLFGITPTVMKPTALLLNIFVSLIAFAQFYRGNHFRWSVFWPLALAAVPMAFLGGQMVIDGSLYKKILGVLLLFPILRFAFWADIPASSLKKASTPLSLLLGGGIGYLSGLIGIGGGIILSPILLLLRYTTQQQTAAISALFIFVNSLSGLAGQLTKGIQFSTDMVAYVAVAVAGGTLGAYTGALRLQQQYLKYLLAMVLLIAVYKLLFTAA